MFFKIQHDCEILKIRRLGRETRASTKAACELSDTQVAAVEKQKLVYVMNRDASSNLTISSPLEAHKAATIARRGVSKVILERSLGEKRTLEARVLWLSRNSVPRLSAVCERLERASCPDRPCVRPSELGIENGRLCARFRLTPALIFFRCLTWRRWTWASTTRSSRCSS